MSSLFQHVFMRMFFVISFYKKWYKNISSFYIDSNVGLLLIFNVVRHQFIKLIWI